VGRFQTCCRLVVFFIVAAGVLPAAEVKVAWFNLENYIEREDGSGQLAKPETRIDAVVKTITDIRPDILAVAEIGDQAALADLQTRLKLAGWEFTSSEWVAGLDQSRHLALLSRYPIVERNSQDALYFTLDGVRHGMHRGILDVTIELTPGYRLRMLGAHFKSRRDEREYDQAAFRLAEARVFRSYVEGILKKAPKTNLLAAGDLNDTKNEPAIREIIGTPREPGVLRDIWVRDSRQETWTHYWKVADVYSRIDYLLTSPGLSPEIQWRKCGIADAPYWSQASDHRAIYAVLSPENK
jgi:endonuclease/exonuclease/phosphatase family metal-dependent hydrolase